MQANLNPFAALQALKALLSYRKTAVTEFLQLHPPIKYRHG
jgi:hypothetical protein